MSPSQSIQMDKGHDGDMVLLAVYGTLKQGHHNHKVHLNRKPVYAGSVSLHAEMHTNGRYPMLIKSEQKNTIFLEIYEISETTLAEIDSLEEPFGYHREQIDIADNMGVWIYYFSKGIAPEKFRQVETGNFEKEREWDA